MQVAKWGNSLAIRLPAAVVEALKLKEGDEMERAEARGLSRTIVATQLEGLSPDPEILAPARNQAESHSYSQDIAPALTEIAQGFGP